MKMKEFETTKTACYSCGKIITVMVPLDGCYICADCMNVETFRFYPDMSESKQEAGI